jgi:hypothetical protein
MYNSNWKSRAMKIEKTKHAKIEDAIMHKGEKPCSLMSND